MENGKKEGEGKRKRRVPIRFPRMEDGLMLYAKLGGEVVEQVEQILDAEREWDHLPSRLFEAGSARARCSSHVRVSKTRAFVNEHLGIRVGHVEENVEEVVEKDFQRFLHKYRGYVCN